MEWVEEQRIFILHQQVALQKSLIQVHEHALHFPSLTPYYIM